MSAIPLNGIPTFLLAYYAFKLNKNFIPGPLGQEPGQIGPDTLPPPPLCF
jgi:hypothetical protein